MKQVHVRIENGIGGEIQKRRQRQRYGKVARMVQQRAFSIHILPNYHAMLCEEETNTIVLQGNQQIVASCKSVIKNLNMLKKVRGNLVDQKCAKRQLNEY